MISLHYPKHFQAVRQLSFCYLCGNEFLPDEKIDRDHVPPKTVFAKVHRVPLILKTHAACNEAHSPTDEKMGQLIGLSRGAIPTDPKNSRLQIQHLGFRTAAITNIDVHGAIWRWVRGFHAALYREPLPEICQRAIELPFQRARRDTLGFSVVPLREAQHVAFVRAIKTNRAKQNVDRIRCNADKLTYECVWAQNEGNREWGCIFALDVYDWKDLGDPKLGQRGCAGVYSLPDGHVPPNAARLMKSSILVPNTEPLDPFGR
ncbi:MAG: hypothetical protein JSR91_08645 [Proteobacteria bacterium]|nr:hypothetical protein [Pseudomonadota bacterium]